MAAATRQIAQSLAELGKLYAADLRQREAERQEWTAERQQWKENQRRDEEEFRKQDEELLRAGPGCHGDPVATDPLCPPSGFPDPDKPADDISTADKLTAGPPLSLACSRDRGAPQELPLRRGKWRFGRARTVSADLSPCLALIADLRAAGGEVRTLTSALAVDGKCTRTLV